MKNHILAVITVTMLLAMTVHVETQAAARHSQPRAIETASGWNTTFGGPANDRGWAIHPVENGVVLAGWTASYGAGSADGWMLMLDNDGREIWNHTYGGSGTDRIVAMEPTDDGYILAGYTTSHGDNFFSDLWLLSTDGQGNERWNRTYGGIDHEQGWAVCVHDDGFAVTGYTGSYGAGNSDLWLLSTDGQGNEQWNATFGGIACETGFAIEAVDEGFVVAGYYESCGGPYDLWLLSTDGQGNERWNKTYGGDGQEVARSMTATDDGYALTGWTTTYGAGRQDCWLLVTDSEGDLQVSRTYGGPGNDGGFSIAPLEDGFAVAGFTGSYSSGGQDCWLLSTDGEGDVRWEYVTGGPGDDVAYALAADDGIYRMAGVTDSYGAGDDDLWLLTFDDPGFSMQPRGGFGMTVQVSSSIAEERTDLAWTARLDGRVLPSRASGVIRELPAGGSTTLSVPTFGLGPVAVEIHVGDVQRHTSFVGLGPFLLPAG